ncbi:MAG: glycosyltransferase family 2 protein [Xanthomonadales bacterium]|nr:glycosyltransferase family 2 protein [Gammaproteobacteria bacterium]NND56630.1 glycosyltransferase family 2 protein [Xanthomonadales bacterium]NNK52428.1 glycosyltransferase family 2 protein [Xanthomonadales bacterium]
MQEAGVKPAVEVIVVNFNAGSALVRCIQSILAQQQPVNITVADNASTDGSISRLLESLGPLDNLAVLANDQNLGFASAINEAARLRELRGRYLLILNPDCEMLPGSLAAMIEALEQDEQAGLAGPMVVNREHQPMRGTLRRFPGPGSAFLTFSGLWRLARWFPFFSGVEMMDRLPAETATAEAVSGACMLLRVSDFLSVGGMDGDYGLHCEDLDLMYRLRQKGRHCLFVPAAQVFHAQGVSSSGRPVWVHWQKHLGMQRFFKKFQAGQTFLLLRWLVLAGIWLRFVVTLPLVWIRR